MKSRGLFGMRKWMLLSAFVLLLAACNDEAEELTETPEEEDIEETETIEDEAVDEEVVEEEEDTYQVQFTQEDLFYDPHIYRLVNKDHALGEGYVPSDLVTVDVAVVNSEGSNQLRQIASQALTNLFEAAENNGHILYADSGFRSYETQEVLYNGYVERSGQAEADRYSAQPGKSEHQTGLTMDVTADSVGRQLVQSFGETDEGIWVRENAHRYGFIVRYPEGKEEITKYMYEPWHLRFLGIALATEIYESGLTYEEYLEERGFDIE